MLFPSLDSCYCFPPAYGSGGGVGLVRQETPLLRRPHTGWLGSRELLGASFPCPLSTPPEWFGCPPQCFSCIVPVPVIVSRTSTSWLQSVPAPDLELTDRRAWPDSWHTVGAQFVCLRQCSRIVLAGTTWEGILLTLGTQKYLNSFMCLWGGQSSQAPGLWSQAAWFKSQMCDLGQGTYPFRVSVSWPVRWG